MVNDREMLKLAAKAAGISVNWHGDTDPWCYAEIAPGIKWNPLTDDGDNARLEAMLGLNMIWGSRSVRVGHKIIKDGPTSERYQDHGGDRQKARRWASVRAAAEIGRAMK